MDIKTYDQKSFDEFWRQNTIKESIDFNYTKFDTISFPENMKNQTFYDCCFENCNFNGANISLSHFHKCIFNNSQFRRSRVMRTNFFKSKFDSVEWVDCDFSSANFIAAQFNQVICEKCNFIYANFVKSNYEDLIMTACNTEYTLLEYQKEKSIEENPPEDKNLEVVQFLHDSYQKLNIMNQLLIDRIPKITMKDFYNELSIACEKIIPEVAVKENRLSDDEISKKLQLHKVSITSIIDGKGKIADFTGIDLSGYSFQELNLKGAVFKDCILDCCNFAGCNLENCDFSNSSMKDTNLFMAIFGKNNFTNVDLSQVIFDQVTKKHFESENLISNSKKEKSLISIDSVMNEEM